MHPRTLQMMRETDTLSERMVALSPRLQEAQAPDPYGLGLSTDRNAIATTLMQRMRPPCFEEDPDARVNLQFYHDLFNLIDIGFPDDCWEWIGGDISVNWIGIGEILIDVRPLVYNLWVADCNPYTHVCCPHHLDGAGIGFKCCNPNHLEIVNI